MNLLSSVDVVDATPIDHWVAQQGDLSAVERFSQRHADAQHPLQARYYRDLLPARAPGPGQQYAFSVDLDACTGCKACVSACHSLNGLDDEEEWRRVTLLTGTRDARAYQQHVTAACHHCVDPACMKGCPVDAYEKDPVTGIVAHLDDQCIGCSYCTLTCPYEVPVYDHHRGIVRKCDLCAGRLAAGEAPACVQGCPNAAIAVTVVDVATTTAAATTGSVVPGAPPSSITVPTTRYRSARGVAVDDTAVAPVPVVAHAHPPLTIMLVLTQLAVGAFVTDALLRWAHGRGAGDLPAFDAVVVVVAAMVALGASVLHLGRPLHAYRAVIGLRHSWLSREVVAFGAFTGLALPYAFVIAVAPDVLGDGATTLLALGVIASGVGGIACSVLIYACTRRASWTVPAVTAKFLLTGAVCGTATVLWVSALGLALGSNAGLGSRSIEQLLWVVLAGLVLLKLAGEASGFRHLGGLGGVGGASGTEGARRARVLAGALRTEVTVRFAVGLGAGVVLPLMAAVAVDGAASPVVAALLASVALVGIVVGELIERMLFFTAASPPR